MCGPFISIECVDVILFLNKVYSERIKDALLLDE